jgi:O-antigen ligase
MMRGAAVKSEEQPLDKGVLMLMGAVACLLTYLVIKEVQLPKMVIILGSIAGSVWLLTQGLSKPELVTYALVAYVPFSKQLNGDFGGAAMALNFTNLLMGYIMLVWFTGRFSKGEPMWISSALNIPIFIFLVIGAVSIVRGSYYTGYMHYALVGYKRWITPIFLYFLVLNTVKDRRTIQHVIAIIMIVTTLVGLMAIYDYFDLGHVSSLEKSRIGGIADQPNMLAAFFNYYMFLPLGFFLMNMNKGKYWLLLIPFLICFRGIMVTFSRGGYLAFALGLYAIIFFRSKIMFGLMVLLTFAAITFPVLLPGGIRYRMGQTFQGPPATYSATMEQPADSLESSASTRVEVWKGALVMIGQHPFWGVGYGLFQPMIKYYWSGQKPIDAHNTYLIIAAEMGIPALLVFLLIVLIVFWHTFSLYRNTQDPFDKAVALGFIGGLFGLLMSNMFGSRLDSQEVSGYFWILAALVMRLKILDRQEGRFAAKGRKLDVPRGTDGAEIVPLPIRRRMAPRKLDSVWSPARSLS